MDNNKYKYPKIINEDIAIARLKEMPRPWANDYLAMYSSWLDDIITYPWLMSVPIDDHIVHRGDGVFEMSKCVGGRIYQFDKHLERLVNSAKLIHLSLPVHINIMKFLAIEVVRAAGEQNCALRIYISRGPGGFTTDPKECVKSGMYIIVTRLHEPDPRLYLNGVHIGISYSIPSKKGVCSSVKSCNYLPNVLLKIEAMQRGWDYAIGLDENGNLGEGSTENIGLVDQYNCLLLPLADYILEGTTVRRAKEIADILVSNGVLTAVNNQTLTIDTLMTAKEVMLFGTILDVLPVVYLNNKPLANGQVGPIFRELFTRMRYDITYNLENSTPVFI